MTNTKPSSAASGLWTVVSQEITGIQLLWEAVTGQYFEPHDKGLTLRQLAWQELEHG